MASTLAAPFVLGVPAEMYAYGTEFSLMIIGYAIGIPACTHFFYTRFYCMGITSVYEVRHTVLDDEQPKRSMNCVR